MIRVLPPTDLDAVRELRAALHRHHDALPVPPGYRLRAFEAGWLEWRDTVAEAVAAGTAVVFVHSPDDDATATPDGMAYLHLLAHAPLTRPFLEPVGTHVELSTLVVADTARGSGVGSALADAGTAWARARDAVALHIAVRATNVDARRLYVRRGAQPTFEVLVEPLLDATD